MAQNFIKKYKYTQAKIIVNNPSKYTDEQVEEAQDFIRKYEEENRRDE